MKYFSPTDVSKTINIFKRFNYFNHEKHPYIHHHCLEERKGNVNWVAIVAYAPKGLVRLFLKRNKLGTMFLVPECLKVGDLLEFGGDRVTKTFRYKYREYYMVEERTETCLNLGQTKVLKTRVRLSDIFLPQDK